MSNEMSWGLRSQCYLRMGHPHWSNWVNNILEAETVKNRFKLTSRHFFSILVLWILLESQWQADGAKLVNTSALNRAQLINTSALNLTLPPGLNLNDQNKTVKNFAVPLPVYVVTPLMTALISIGAVWGFCWWKLKLVRRRKKLLEKAQLRRRRSSLKPGSSERGKKFGLTRAVGPDGDPLIIPTAKVLGLARKLDDVEQLVLDYQSYDMGDRLPEKHEYKVEEVEYSISINPLFNSLQSGACGYVLSGDERLAASQPGEKKPEEGSGDDSDSDGSPKKRPTVVLPKLSVSKKASSALTSPPRLSRLSVETKSKEDTLRRSLAKSIIEEAAKEESSAGESSDDASSIDSDATDASSVESLDAKGGSSKQSTLVDELSARSSLRSSKLAAFAEVSAGDSDQAIASPKSPASSRLSKVSSSRDSQTRASSSPEPSKSAVSREESPRASLSPRASKAAVSGEDSPSAGSGEDTPSLSPKTSKTADSGEDSPTASLSPRSSKAVVSDEESPRQSLSPRSSMASVSPQASSTLRAPKAAHSDDEDSPRESLSPRSLKSAISEKDSETSLFASPSRLSTKGSVSPRFSHVTTSDTDQKKPDWNPSTVPERSSIKKSVAPGSISRGSKSQGASPNEPSSPTKRVASPSRKATASSSEPETPKKASVTKAAAGASSSKSLV